MKTQHIFLAVAIILALLLGLSSWQGMRLKKEKRELIQEKEELSGELSGLEEIRDNLATEVDSLQEAYFQLAEENENLQGSLAEAQKQVAQKSTALRNASRRSASEVNDLKAQIQELLQAKTDLENSIILVQAENDSLRTRTGILENDLSIAQQENQALANLNRTIQDELERLTLANYKASAFRVEVGQKNAKLTAKSRRARTIAVDFDLTNVPEEFQGVQPIYLTISDEKGTPIQATNPIQAEVNVNGQPMDIIAVESKEVNIAASQRLSFKHQLSEKLAPGFYRAAVFSDIGLLGATSFRLR